MSVIDDMGTTDMDFGQDEFEGFTEEEHDPNDAKIEAFVEQYEKSEQSEKGYKERSPSRGRTNLIKEKERSRSRSRSYRSRSYRSRSRSFSRDRSQSPSRSSRSSSQDQRNHFGKGKGGFRGKGKGSFRGGKGSYGGKGKGGRGYQSQGKGSYNKDSNQIRNVCAFFNTSNGCKNGSNCKYLHDVNLIATDNVHRCPNPNCTNSCIGKQCSVCHRLQKEAKYPKWKFKETSYMEKQSKLKLCPECNINKCMGLRCRQCHFYCVQRKD